MEQKGILERDTPVMNFINTAAEVLFIGLLWLVFSAPVITLGPATAAAYYAMTKVVRKKRGTAGKEFLHSIKENLKHGILLTVLYGSVIAVIVFFVVSHERFAAVLGNSYIGILVMLVLPVGFTLPYVFPVLSRFDSGIGKTLQMAVIMSVSNPLRTLPLMLMTGLVCVLCILLPFMLLILPGFLLLFTSFLVEGVLVKWCRKKENVSENQDDIPWYLE